MKKVFALLLISSLGLTSCSSDDDGSNGPNYSMVGKWNITTYTINGEEFDECTLNGVRQFKQDGTYLQDEFVENETTGACEETENSPLIGTWTKSNDTVHTSVTGEDKTYDLEFISETKFTLTETYNNIDFVYTFSKVQ
jgi:hypothetical protein